MVQKSTMKTTIIILIFFFASAIGRGVKEVRLTNNWFVNCGGVNIRIKIVSGRNACAVQPKQRVAGNSIASWSGAELGSCRSFPVDGASRVFFQTNSANDGFCPELAQIYMDDQRNTRYHAGSKWWISYYKSNNNNEGHGVTKEWPRDDGYVRPQDEPLLCPLPSADTCPLQEMYAYKVGSRDKKNCLFECTTVASVDKTTNYHETVETGFRCVDVDYDSIQFDWCCKTKSTVGGIPHCPDVITGSPNDPTPITTTEAPVAVAQEVPAQPFAAPGECPESGCPFDKVKTYYEDSRVNERCEIRPECDYVKSADPYDPESGVECERTRNQRRKKTICCKDPTAESNLPACPVRSTNVPPVQNNASLAQNNAVPGQNNELGTGSQFQDVPGQNNELGTGSQFQNDESAGTNTEYDYRQPQAEPQVQPQVEPHGSLADGCPTSTRHPILNPTIENPPHWQIGGVRCCSHDGSQCVTPQDPDCIRTTFESAKGVCNSLGMRICNPGELSGGKCCGTGCRFDGELVWQMTF